MKWSSVVYVIALLLMACLVVGAQCKHIISGLSFFELYITLFLFLQQGTIPEKSISPCIWVGIYMHAYLALSQLYNVCIYLCRSSWNPKDLSRRSCQRDCDGIIVRWEQDSLQILCAFGLQDQTWSNDKRMPMLRHKARNTVFSFCRRMSGKLPTHKIKIRACITETCKIAYRCSNKILCSVRV
jgi:hypothetical protein